MAPAEADGAGAGVGSAEEVAASARAESVWVEAADVREEEGDDELDSSDDDALDDLLEVLELLEVDVVAPITVGTMVLPFWPRYVVSAFWTLPSLRVAQ